MVTWRVRAPRRGDGHAIGQVHVRAWKAAYRGLLPSVFLDGLDEDDGGRAWEGRLAGEPIPTVAPLAHQVLVVESGAGAPEPSAAEGASTDIVGVATVGPDRNRPGEATGELWMLNVRPDAWGTGAASRLLEAAQEALSADGYRQAVLWVVAGNNRARRFYERHGWRCDGSEKFERIGGGLVRELRYVLADLTATPPTPTPA